MTPTPRFQPVIVGADVGAYALARQLNDAFDVKPILVTAFSPLAARDSAILTLHHFAQASQEEPLVAELVRLGRSLKEKDPARPLVLLANTEWRVQTIVTHREELAEYYELPFPSSQALALANDKEEFERRATALGIKVPLSFYQDFSGADSPGWEPAPLPEGLTFPVVAKPAASASYEHLAFEGRKKVYRIDSQAELDDLWRRLREAGFRDRFIAQQLIEGDDTSMYICVAYVDSTGQTSFVCSGQLLLGEHDPALLGNPLTIISRQIPQIVEPVTRFLESIDYRGFSNFDVKRDARTGEFYFLEQNPRMGRSSFYCTGADVNPMEVMVRDLICDDRSPVTVGSDPALYTLVPPALVSRYVTTPRLRAQLRDLRRRHRVINPLDNPKDASARRVLNRLLGELGQARKLLRHYPRPTRTGF